MVAWNLILRTGQPRLPLKLRRSTASGRTAGSSAKPPSLAHCSARAGRRRAYRGHRRLQSPRVSRAGGLEPTRRADFLPGILQPRLDQARTFPPSRPLARPASAPGQAQEIRRAEVSRQFLQHSGRDFFQTDRGLKCSDVADTYRPQEAASPLGAVPSHRSGVPGSSGNSSPVGAIGSASLRSVAQLGRTARSLREITPLPMTPSTEPLRWRCSLCHII